MHLFDIPKIIETKNIINLKNNKFFSNLTSNSKNTDKNTILIIDKNTNFKEEYLKTAINNKISAILTNKELKLKKIPQFIVDDLSSAKEYLLKQIYKNLPYKTIAITGTNGKTSVAWYISTIFNQIGINNNYVGTLGYYKNGRKIKDLNLTTPAYEELYKYGSSTKKSKYFYVFEASSHALDQNRINNFPINIAALTNISNDHLDYHKTLSKYKKAKMNLFSNHLSEDGVAIINSRIKNISTIKKNLKNKKIKTILFGNSDIYFKKKSKYYELKILKKNYKINQLKLTTPIELENLECAISCCLSAGIKVNSIIKVLDKISNPPGRLQKLYYKKKDSTIIIDYAHTPDALKKILISEKRENRKPVILFGCGGNRDIYKRKVMGKIASKYASKVYITDDNPRFEDPSKIRKDILRYCSKAIEIPNRKKAIQFAINALLKNDVLIIAGKGHEKFQIIKNKFINFDDMKIVKNKIR